ncbi:hypothetical protein ABZP36_008999 [Zizania latifolia]
MAIIIDILVRSCVKKLQDIITDQAILILGVNKELKELQQTMEQIQYFLIDAEQRRTEELAVHNWLTKLKEAMYDADDIIDLASFEGSKLLEKRPSLPPRCTASSILSCLPNIRRRRAIAVRIRDFKAELEQIFKWGETVLKLQNMRPRRQVSSGRQMKTSQLVEPNLVGKEILHASRKLVDLVLAHKDKKAYKLGIVGIGGIGKTTLAQKIYNDDKLKEVFSKKAWICVSQKYSAVDLLKEVLQNFGVHQEQGESIAWLSSKLAATVEKESFLLVFDDVWHPEVWTDLLRTPLHAAATGIVIVTTRHDNVAMTIGVEHMHQVELMSTKVGWELLWRSMNINEEREVENLRDIGMEIVCKCGGLPLAVKLIARVLATKEKTENQWRKFMDNSAWSRSDLLPELRGALYMSYDDLPRYLKPCFLYCALYPEDCIISRDYLVRFWVAEGFVEEQDHQPLEDIAEEYYYELINRNLLQRETSFYGGSVCIMHDLLRQLAWYIAEEENFLRHPESLVANTLIKLRRCGIHTEKDMAMLHSLGKDQIVTTRSLIIFGSKSLEFENSLFVTLPNVRILDLFGALVKSIPDCIGGMIHLRLFDLNTTSISCLPESIGSLKNLQTLNLSECTTLHKLPLAITKLCNLRQLGLRGTPISEVPKGIGSLKFLNHLYGFPISGRSDNTITQDGWNLEELEHLSQLRKLQMIKLERASPCSSMDPLLTDKKHLKVLHLYYSEQTDEAYSEEDICNIEKICEHLTPPRNLEELYIVGFFGQRYPNWLGSTNLSSLKLVKLVDCKCCVHLPPIGQLPSLKCLEVHGATNVTEIGPEFLGCCLGNLTPNEAVAFPKLEVLVIKDMPNWEEWSFVEGDEQVPRMQLLPCLKRVSVVHCPKLRGLPRQLGQEASKLEHVYIEGANCLKTVDDLPFLSRKLVISKCEGLERISNLPQVRELHLHGCPNLRCVDEVVNFDLLCLDACMKDNPGGWVNVLLEQGRWRLGDDLYVHMTTR